MYGIWRSQIDGEISNLILTKKLNDSDKETYLLNLLPSRVDEKILCECNKLGAGTTTSKTLMSEIEKVWKSKQRVSLQSLIQHPINSRDDVEQIVIVMRKLIIIGFTTEAVVTTCIEAIPDITIRNQLLLSSNPSNFDNFVENLRKVQWQHSVIGAVVSNCKLCNRKHVGKCWKQTKCYNCAQVGHIQRFCPQKRNLN